MTKIMVWKIINNKITQQENGDYLEKLDPTYTHIELLGPVDGDQNVSKVDQSLFEQIGSEIVTTYEEIRYTPEMENSRISVESGYGNKRK